LSMYDIMIYIKMAARYTIFINVVSQKEIFALINFLAVVYVFGNKY
jgi:uncharacterized protein YueI